MDIAFTGTLVEAISPCVTADRDTIVDSHPSPLFSNVCIRLDSVRLSTDGARAQVLGNVTVSAVVTSSVCDLIPGDPGTIPSVEFEVNGETVASIPTRITKSDGTGSFLQPYPMTASCEAQFSDVELSTGNNCFKLRATDSVPGVGLTGMVEFLARLTATPVEQRDPQGASNPSEREPVFVHAGDSWRLSFVEPKEYCQSKGGGIHPYYLRLDGSPETLTQLSKRRGSGVGQGPDGNYYLAREDGLPEANVLVLLARQRAIRESATTGQSSFEKGFVEGFVWSGASIACGSLEVQWADEAADPPVVTVPRHAARLRQLRIDLARACSLPDRIESCSEAARAVFEYLQAVNNAERFETRKSIATMEWAPLLDGSQDLARMGGCGLILLNKVETEFRALVNPRICGHVQGQICLAILSCFIAVGRQGYVSHSEVFAQLKESDLFRTGRNASALEQTIARWNSLPF